MWLFSFRYCLWGVLIDAWIRCDKNLDVDEITHEYAYMPRRNNRNLLQIAFYARITHNLPTLNVIFAWNALCTLSSFCIQIAQILKIMIYTFSTYLVTPFQNASADSEKNISVCSKLLNLVLLAVGHILAIWTWYVCCLIRKLDAEFIHLISLNQIMISIIHYDFTK